MCEHDPGCEEYDGVNHPRHYALVGGQVQWREPNEHYLDPEQAGRDRAARREQGRSAVRRADWGRRETVRRLARTDEPTAQHAAEVFVFSGARRRVIDRVATLLLDHVGIWLDAERFDRIAKSGERRMRELRDNYDWPIEIRDKPGAINVYQHRLTGPPPGHALRTEELPDGQRSHRHDHQSV